MIDEFSDDQAGSPEPSSEMAQEANGVAFLLASAAYLALADAYMRREGPQALTVMEEIEDRIEEALQSFVTETSYDEARPDILAHATAKIRALLEAGRSMSPGPGSLQ
jgi:hypothetical protein